MPNAAHYDDEGSDTLGHIDEHMKPFNIPHLADLGLANLHPLQHVESRVNPLGYYTKMLEASVGKRYDDRSLGNDGITYHDTFSNIHGNRLSKRTAG